MSIQRRQSNFLADLVADNVDDQLTELSFPQMAFIVWVTLEVPHLVEEVSPEEQEAINRAVKTRVGVAPRLTVAYTERYAALVAAY